MFGVTRDRLERIYEVAYKLEPTLDMKSPGAWGILFVCCGAMAMYTDCWSQIAKSSDIFVCLDDLEKVLQGEKVKSSDDCVLEFTGLIKSWCASPEIYTETEKKLAIFKPRLSPKSFDYHHKWAILAEMFNSMKKQSLADFLGYESDIWVNLRTSEHHNFSWPEMIFASGLTLASEPEVEWNKLASALYAMNAPFRQELSCLFEFYYGRPLFSKSKSKKIGIDDLEKGDRIKLKNGWEATVIEKSNNDDNTLIAKVYGDFTETGSIYIDTIDKVKIDGQWVKFEMTEDQKQFKTLRRTIFDY